MPSARCLVLVVFHLTGLGPPSGEIAATLCLCATTVASHKENIKRKRGSDSATGQLQTATR
ncbi:MAG: DNA-binding NarL/FixJ family response regulator [Myxococcota bacterium]|jgi:DNA-binding NarL/FixJ family response regulator